jgi:DNA-binding MarR family transcriptional regulator
LSRLAEALGFGNPSTVKQAIQELGDELGPVLTYRFHSRRTEGYTAEQQELVRVHLEKQGYRQPPEGYLTQHSLAEMLGPHDTIIARIIRTLGEELGQVQSFKSKRGITLFYSPEQQEMIREALAAGQFLDEPPEGVLSITGIAKAYDVGRGPAESAITKLGEDLGEVRTYKFPGGNTKGYSAEQQGMLLGQMYADGAFAEPAPEGIVSIYNMAQSSRFRVGYDAIKSAVESLGDKLGEVNVYKFGSRATEGYTPDQQELILKHLQETGHLGNAPEGYVHATELAAQLEVPNHVIYNIAGYLGEALGETKAYRTAARTAIHYSPAQQEAIRNAIAERGLFASDPPEGYMTIAGIAKDLGLAHQTVSKSVQKLGEVLEGAIGYKFGSQTVTGYSPHQQEVIAQHAIERLILKK